MMILRGVTFFPYHDLGGRAVENDIEHRGGQPFFSCERKKNMLLDGLIILVIIMLLFHLDQMFIQN